MASLRAPFRAGAVSTPCLRSRAEACSTPPLRFLQGIRCGEPRQRANFSSSRGNGMILHQHSRVACPQPRSVRREQCRALAPRSILSRPAYSSPYSSSATSAAADGPSSAASSEASVRPEPPDHLDEKERAIFDRLNEALEPVALQVEDISGGCGSMYAVAITADKFKGLPVIKQHRLVNQVLGDEIKNWHGIQLRTKAP